MNKVKIYFAAPLFTNAELLYNEDLKKKIEALGVEVLFPQEFCLNISSPNVIFSRCRDNVDKADFVVAMLDGTQVDDGTAWEIAYAYAKGKSVVGLRTDSRQSGDCKGATTVNCMIHCSCMSIVYSEKRLLEEIEKILKNYFNKS